MLKRAGRAGLVIVVLTSLMVSVAAAAAQEPAKRSELREKTQKQLTEIAERLDGVMGYVIVDLESGERFERLGGETFPLASTIKLAILYELFKQADEGRLKLDEVRALDRRHAVGGSGILIELTTPAMSLRDYAVLMVVVSDNTATNLLIDRLGTARINARLDTYGLRETRLFRATFRDGKADVLPELEREYGLGVTTPREMARLMALIAQRKTVNRQASDAMLATLGRQQDRAMIPRLLPAVPGLTTGNKTGTDAEKHPGADGTYRHVRADAAIVSGPNLSYVVAIYARQVEDTRWGVDNDALTAGARISRLLFDHFEGRR